MMIVISPMCFITITSTITFTTTRLHGVTINRMRSGIVGYRFACRTAMLIFMFKIKIIVSYYFVNCYELFV